MSKWTQCLNCYVTTYGTSFCSDQCEVAYVPAPDNVPVTAPRRVEGELCQEEVTISVQECMWSENVIVMVPPKYWGKLALAEGIRKAIEVTFDPLGSKRTMKGWQQKHSTPQTETPQAT